jgi:hypothetical protein
MKTFFGFQNLFRFIYDEKKEEYIEREEERVRLKVW